MKKLYLGTIFIVILSFFSIGIFTSYGVSAVVPVPPGGGPTEDNLAWWCDVVNAEKVWGGYENAKDIHTTIHGGGIKVCIIDSGIDYTHPDLYHNYKGGVDYVSGDYDPKDHSPNYHGTKVAGTIAMEDNEVGYIGIAPRVDLYVVRAIGRYGFYNNDSVKKALLWAIKNEMDIVSMSLMDNEENDPISNTLNDAYEAGIILVAASGNYYGEDWPSNVQFPARHQKVIAVGAINSDFFRADLSNTGQWGDPWGSCYGTDLDLVAPGVDIDTTGKSPTYVTTGGTSLACAIVAGVCALILSASLNIYILEDGSRVDAVKDCLINTANSLIIPEYDENEYGDGLVNAYAAVQYALDPDRPWN